MFHRLPFPLPHLKSSKKKKPGTYLFGSRGFDVVLGSVQVGLGVVCFWETSPPIAILNFPTKPKMAKTILATPLPGMILRHYWIFFLFLFFFAAPNHSNLASLRIISMQPPAAVVNYIPDVENKLI